MSNVLVREVPDDVLATIRQAATGEGLSLQGYLLRTLTAQARFERRQAALTALAHDLDGRPAWTSQDHDAAVEAGDLAVDERGAELADRGTP